MPKVTAGREYIYKAEGLDRFDPRTDLKDGERVRVINLPGCPKANTMRMCHVERILPGPRKPWPYSNGFAGLVLTASPPPQTRITLIPMITTFTINQRVQLHPGTDAWMSGDRYGTIIKIGRKSVHVLLDRSNKVRKFAPSRILPL